jgi:hypothetical protein
MASAITFSFPGIVLCIQSSSSLKRYFFYSFCIIGAKRLLFHPFVCATAEVTVAII